MSVTTIIPGNVGNEIEFFQFGQGGEGMKFDVAVTDDMRGEQVTRWYKIACFGRVKDAAKQLHEDGKLAQGAKVLVIGTFLPRDYTNRNGETKTSFDCTASSVEVLYSKPQQQQNPLYPDTDGFEYADDDDDAMPSF